jgi:hypothetical protein
MGHIFDKRFVTTRNSKMSIYPLEKCLNDKMLTEFLKVQHKTPLKYSLTHNLI